MGTAPSYTLWRLSSASIWLRTDLYAQGGDGYESATFSYEPDSIDEDGPAVAGKFFFNEGRIVVDTDGSGSIDSENNEYISVTAGSATVTRMVNSAQMSFDLALEDGVTVKGDFMGVFPLFEN